MSYKKCVTCAGSGQLMGGGMITDDCYICEGTGKIRDIENKEIDILEKHSESYQKMKQEIIEKSGIIDENKVESMLDEALSSADTRKNRSKKYQKD